jgi:type I restriction enzyme, S subunit
MPSNWIKFGDIVVESRGGTSIKTSEYTAIGTPVLTKGDVKPFGRVEHGGKFVDTKIAKEQGWRFSKRGDLIVTTRDLTLAANFLGLVSRIPEDSAFVINQGATIFSIDESRIDPRYLVYWCCGPEYRQHIQDNYVGSTQIHIRQEDLFSAPLKLPTMAEQLAIVEVLGAFDDKIELNRRMNSTLEAMARSLFQSWFVDFNPVRAKLDGRSPVALDADTAVLFPEHWQDSSLGQIPKGWTAGKLGDIGANSRRGVQPSAIAPNTPYIALEHMPRRCIALGDWDETADVASGKSAFKKGEILFGKLRPYFHKVGVAPFDGVCSTDILVLAPKRPEWFGFLLGHTSSEELIQFTDHASTGTKMPRTNWNDISSYKVALPPIHIAAAFTRTIQPMIDRIHTNLRESRSLAVLRDALVPKLLSGELSATYPGH